MNYYTKRKILNLFFPSRCPVCDEIINVNDRFCPDCTEKITSYTGSFRISGASEFFSAFEYNKKIMPAVFLLKKGNCGNSAHAFGACLADVLKNNNISEKTDIIVPVPMSDESRQRRGYNQSELIAETVSAEINKPVKCIVRKIRETKEQKSLRRAGRKLNLRDAFQVTENITGKRILLIDDICTTGSTLSEIAVLFRKNGAEDVICATAMKVMKKKTDT
ncbi:MAG: double zinc ribbon domain-containing protein [Ruminococcus sp.]|nr:double zinc ribbon domain-containing protein [Ruminococcus sp.]